MDIVFLSNENHESLAGDTALTVIDSITVKASTAGRWPHDELMEKLEKATTAKGGHAYNVIVNNVDGKTVFTKADIIAVDETLEGYTALLIVRQPLSDCVSTLKRYTSPDDPDNVKGIHWFPRKVHLKEAMHTYRKLTEAFNKRFEKEDKWAVAKEFLVALQVRYMGSEHYVEV